MLSLSTQIVYIYTIYIYIYSFTWCRLTCIWLLSGNANTLVPDKESRLVTYASYITPYEVKSKVILSYSSVLIPLLHKPKISLQSQQWCDRTQKAVRNVFHFHDTLGHRL